MNINVIIMAAGKGTRMRSDLPKVLHQLGGKPLLQHVISASMPLHPDRLIIVTGYQSYQVQRFVMGLDTDLYVQFAHQEPQLGTGHAVQQTLKFMQPEGVTLVLNGDVPLISSRTLARLVALASGYDQDRLALLTVNMNDPTGYGRIVRRGGRVQGIVEEKDADATTKLFSEVYTGVLACPNHLLRRWVDQLKDDNAQGEYYLTDIVKFAVQDHVNVVTTQADSVHEVLGVNSPEQLALLEGIYQGLR